MMFESRKDLLLWIVLKDMILPILRKQVTENYENYERVKKENFPNAVCIEGVLTLRKREVYFYAPIDEMIYGFSFMLDEGTEEGMGKDFVLQCIFEDGIKTAADRFADQIIKQLEEVDSEAKT